MVARALNEHEYAVHLDILRLGYRKSDWFTTLSTFDMIAIIAGADPNSAIYHAFNGGWTTSDHLLATMYEQQAGLVPGGSQRIARPGVTDVRPARLPDLRDKKTRKLTFDSMTIDEYEARMARLKGA
jgi:hypothetical protein